MPTTNQDLPTFDGQALGGDTDAWATKLQELKDAARDAVQDNQPDILQAAKQALEAYVAFPCPDAGLRDDANQILDALALDTIEAILAQLQNLQPLAVAMLAPSFGDVLTRQPTVAQPTPRQRLLNTFYMLQALQKQHVETPFKHPKHRGIGRQLNALLATTQALLEQ